MSDTPNTCSHGCQRYEECLKRPRCVADDRLRKALVNVAESLASRPPELRGPFVSGATKARRRA